MSKAYSNIIEVMRAEERAAEFPVLRRVAVDRNARAELRLVLKPFVSRIVSCNCIPGDRMQEKLEKVAMTHFDKALDRYLARRGHSIGVGENPYAFSTYFVRWITRSIDTYWSVAKHPLPGIAPNPESAARRAASGSLGHLPLAA